MLSSSPMLAVMVLGAANQEKVPEKAGSKHNQNMQHIRSTQVFRRTSPEFRATQSILILVSSYVPHSVCRESCGPEIRKFSLEDKSVHCYDCTPCPDNEISTETDVDQCVNSLEKHFANTQKNHPESCQFSSS
ncbi:hypothetical protein ACRRTK_001120 [Alexandromys fortis]